MALENLPPSESPPKPNPALPKAGSGDSGVEGTQHGSDAGTLAAGVHQALHSDSYTAAPTTPRVDLSLSNRGSFDSSFLEMPPAWTSPASTSSPLRLDNSPFVPTGAFDFNAAPNLSFAPRGDSALGPASLSGSPYAGFNFNDNTSLGTQFDSTFFNPETSSYLNNGGTKLLNGVFDEAGDALKTASPKPSGDDASIKTMLAAHQSGDSWSANGTSYFKDKSGDLVAQDHSGFHYYGANGMRMDAQGGNATMSVDGKTIQKVGDKYYKEYPDGEKVEITEKSDIKAIVNFEGHMFEQTNKALKQLNAQTMQEAAQHQGERIITAADGTAVFHTFENGDVLGKDSHTHGSVARLQDGDMYAVRDDKVYKLNANGQPGTALEGNALPPGMTLDATSGHIMFHGVDLSGNGYHDTAHGVSMADHAQQINVQTAKGDVVASSVNGQEKIATPDRTFDYDCHANTMKVTNPDNSVDLSFNYQSQILNTEGVTFTPTGTSFGDYSYSYDSNTASYDGTDVLSSGDDGSGSSYSSDGSAVQADVTDANNDATDIGSSLASGNDGAVYALADDEIGDINAALAAPKLSAGQVAQLSIKRDQAYAALAKADSQVAAASKSNELAGITRPDLTQEIALGGDRSAAEILRRKGLLPDTQIDA